MNAKKILALLLGAAQARRQALLQRRQVLQHPRVLVQLLARVGVLVHLPLLQQALTHLLVSSTPTLVFSSSTLSHCVVSISLTHKNTLSFTRNNKNVKNER